MCDTDDPNLVISAGDSIFRDDAAVLNHDYTRRHDPHSHEDSLYNYRVAWQCANRLVRKNDLHEIPLKFRLPAHKYHGNTWVAVRVDG